MIDEPELRRWRSEADRALAGARAQASIDLHNWACFGAEQAAQLALKGLLHGIGAAPWGHDLTDLGAKAVDAGVAVPAEVAGMLQRLSRHYISTRYADAHAAGSAGDHYNEADSEAAIAEAEAVLAWVDSCADELGR